MFFIQNTLTTNGMKIYKLLKLSMGRCLATRIIGTFRKKIISQFPGTKLKKKKKRTNK